MKQYKQLLIIFLLVSIYCMQTKLYADSVECVDCLNTKTNEIIPLNILYNDDYGSEACAMCKAACQDKSSNYVAHSYKTSNETKPCS